MKEQSRFINDYPDVLMPEEVMAILGIGKNKIYKLLQSGELQSLKIGKSYRIPKSYLLDYIGVS